MYIPSCPTDTYRDNHLEKKYLASAGIRSQLTPNLNFNFRANLRPLHRAHGKAEFQISRQGGGGRQAATLTSAEFGHSKPGL